MIRRSYPKKGKIKFFGYTDTKGDKRRSDGRKRCIRKMCTFGNPSDTSDTSDTSFGYIDKPRHPDRLKSTSTHFCAESVKSSLAQK